MRSIPTCRFSNDVRLHPLAGGPAGLQLPAGAAGVRLADAEKAGIEIQHGSGADVEKAVHRLFVETSREAIARAKAIAD
jgi:NOL1/NOP2/fmu family ribosome biogenesis protein